MLVISMLAFSSLWRYVGYQRVYEYRVGLPSFERYNFDMRDDTKYETGWVYGVLLYSIGFSLAIMNCAHYFA